MSDAAALSFGLRNCIICAMKCTFQTKAIAQNQMTGYAVIDFDRRDPNEKMVGISDDAVDAGHKPPRMGRRYRSTGAAAWPARGNLDAILHHGGSASMAAIYSAPTR